MRTFQSVRVFEEGIEGNEFVTGSQVSVNEANLFLHQIISESAPSCYYHVSLGNNSKRAWNSIDLVEF